MIDAHVLHGDLRSTLAALVSIVLVEGVASTLYSLRFAGTAKPPPRNSESCASPG